MQEDWRTRGAHLRDGRRDLAGSGRIRHCLRPVGWDLASGNGRAKQRHAGTLQQHEPMEICGRGPGPATAGTGTSGCKLLCGSKLLGGIVVAGQWSSTRERQPVRRVKGLLSLSPLGLISRLLRGQVRPLLYIMREDVSI
jgi:hypothetical protein